MTTRNELIHKLLTYINGEKIKIKSLTDEDYLIILRNNKKVVLLADDTWQNLKYKVDTILSNEPKECGICYEKQYMTPCNKCAYIKCLSCHIILLIKNKGLTICPCCRTTWGDENCSSEDIHEEIHSILGRITNPNYLQETKNKIIDFCNISAEQLPKI